MRKNSYFFRVVLVAFLFSSLLVLFVPKAKAALTFNMEIKPAVTSLVIQKGNVLGDSTTNGMSQLGYKINGLEFTSPQQMDSSGLVHLPVANALKDLSSADNEQPLSLYISLAVGLSLWCIVLVIWARRYQAVKV